VTFLFCYGSNHPAQLAERLGHATVNRGAYARDTARVFRGWSERWGGGVASLVRARGVTTYGYLARVTQADLRRMDAFEGIATGHYKRETIAVETVDGDEDAVVYVSLSKQKNAPSQRYLEAVARTIGTFWEGDRGPVRPSDIPIR